MSIISSTRVFQLLQAWETLCLVYEIASKANTKDPKINKPLALNSAALNWQKLRKDIRGPNPIDTTKYFPNDVLQSKHLGMLSTTPFTIADWARSSGRIFKVNVDTQAVFNAMSLASITWADIHFPFQTFAIQLAEPISAYNTEYDCLIVRVVTPAHIVKNYVDINEVNEKILNAMPIAKQESISNFFDGVDLENYKHLDITLVSKQIATLPTISNIERERIRALLKHNPKQAYKDIIVHFQKFQAIQKKHLIITNVSVQLNKMLHKSVASTVKEMRENKATICMCGKDHPEWSAAIRQIIGTCIQLRINTKKKLINWQKRADIIASQLPPNTDINRFLITEDEQICDIAIMTKNGPLTLSTDERSAFMSDKGEEYGDPSPDEKIDGRKVPKWYRGHFRRPPGKGNDLTAEFSVDVIPSLHNKHKLQPGQIPLGAEHAI